MSDLQESLDKLNVVNAKLDNVGADVDELMARIAALEAASGDVVQPELKAAIDAVVAHATALDEKYPVVAPIPA